MLTGDVELVTQKVCREVGFEVRKVVLGAEVEAMSDAQLAVAVREANVFARLTPAHKERIVRSLRAQGNTVGFMGDGINDAPALRAADVGISVDSAVDISKEAADIILLEKSLMVLEDGVIEGRKTFCNMLKYLKMTASSNFGNVFSVLVASAFLPFLPMLPIHLLLQNLMYDISQTAIPFDNVDEELLKKPQQWDPDGLGRFMVFFGPISSIFDIATYALMWYVFQANAPEHQTLFQSGWFVEGLLSQTLIVHMIRTRRIPFLQSRAAWPLMVMTLAVVCLGLFLPFRRWPDTSSRRRCHGAISLAGRDPVELLRRRSCSRASGSASTGGNESVRCRGRRPRRSREKCMKKHYICAALATAGLASPLAARADAAALSGAEVQIYGVVDAGVAVTNVSGVGSRSGMLNGGLTDSLWPAGQGRPGRRLERALPAGKRLRPVHGTAGR